MIEASNIRWRRYRYLSFPYDILDLAEIIVTSAEQHHRDCRYAFELLLIIISAIAVVRDLETWRNIMITV